MTISVHSVWWRTVQLGEFFNIERDPNLLSGGGGARYIEIPSALVPDTQEFLGVSFSPGDEPTEVTISAKTIGAPDVIGTLDFKRKAGGRLRIANQNRQATPGLRHPAWRSDRGFPRAPDDVANSDAARPFYPEGGLRIYIVRTHEGEFYAGFTKGSTPADLRLGHVTRMLYQDGPGGLIRGEDPAL